MKLEDLNNSFFIIIKGIKVIKLISIPIYTLIQEIEFILVRVLNINI